jgi:hypothetical protein
MSAGVPIGNVKARKRKDRDDITVFDSLDPGKDDEFAGRKHEFFEFKTFSLQLPKVERYLSDCLWKRGTSSRDSNVSNRDAV